MQTRTDSVSSPATPAADADHADQWWRALSRAAWSLHARRAAWIACGVVVVGSAASVYLDKVGVTTCESAPSMGAQCEEQHWYAFTVQRRSDVTTRMGARTHRTEWHRSGAMWIDGSYTPSTGERSGVWREQYSDGTPRFEATYAGDEIVGTETWFYPSGKKEWEIGRRNGVRDGEERWYHENGELRRVGTYKNGVREGTFTVFDESGRVAFKGEYLHGANVSGANVD